MGQPITNQAGFRGRNDNGSETAATWKALLDVNWTQLVDAKFRVRFLLTNTGNKDLVDGYRLYYSHNSGTYTRVTTTSNVIQSTVSANTSWTLTDGDDTTQLLGSGTFDTGDWDNNGETDSFTLVQAHETELEWCLTIDSGTVGNGDSIELRVYLDDDSVLDNYLTNKTPNITVSEVSVVNFAATLASATTTPDTPVLGLALELLATLASSTTTPDTVVLDKVITFLATLATATTTPDTVALPIIREISAILASATTTPDTIPANWWDPNDEGLCVWAAYQPKWAGSLAASYTDLSGEGHDAGVVVAPTWDAVNGWIFNGSTQYVTTTFVPQADYSQSVIVQFTNVTTNNTAICNNIASTNGYFGIVPRRWGTMRYCHGGVTAQAPDHLSGNLCVAGQQGYRDGVADGAAIPTGPVDTAKGLYIGAGNLGLYCACKIQAIAIYDCALTSDQVAAVAAAMARTVDSSSLSVSRELSATLASTTVTPDNAILSFAGVIQFLATLAATTTTPDAVTLAVTRDLLAVLASSTTTPDTAAMTVVREFLATLAAATTTPDTASMAVSRAMAAVLASATTTPDTAVLSLAGIIEFAATLAATTTTPDAALALVLEFAATLASSTTTPDTVTLAVVRDLLATLAASTTTPDTVALIKIVNLLATLAASTTTPDTVALALSKAMSAVLSLAGIVEFLATLAASTTTPDTAELAVVRELAATLTAVTTTPDARLGIPRELAATLAAVTTTPDAAVLAIVVKFLATLAASTTTPDTAVLAVARVLLATLAASSTTPDTAAIAVLRELTAMLAAVSTTPDATLAVVREFLATLAAATTSPDDVDLTISIGGDLFLAAVLAAETTTPTIPWGLARGAGGLVGLDVQVPEDYMIMFGDFGAVQLH